jgi:hypothetical protein
MSGVITTFVEFVLQLVSYGVARPLAKWLLLLGAAAVFGGVTTFFLVAVCVVIGNWLVFLVKIIATLVLFFITTTLAFMYMSEDMDRWDQLVRDPSMGWNFTRSYICGGLAHVTHRPIWQCPGVLPPNVTNASLIIL